MDKLQEQSSVECFCGPGLTKATSKSKFQHPQTALRAIPTMPITELMNWFTLELQ